MGNQDNLYVPSYEQRQQVKSWTFAGIPKHIQAKLLNISIDTLKKHFPTELETSKAEIFGQIAECATMKAIEGDSGMQKFIIKMQGGEFGWIEKQVIEQQDSEEMKRLQQQVDDYESKHDKDY